MIVKRTCPFTGKLHEVDLPITEEQYKQWEMGEFVQDAFPNLTPDQREYIISGIYPGEWDKWMGKEE